MKSLGIDLAAKQKNPTGIAIITSNSIKTFTLYTDHEILELIDKFLPDIVAIDAPMTYSDRYAEKYLKKYGAMSLNISSIKMLAIRGLTLKNSIESRGYKVIEVFPTATAKILGFYNRKKKCMLKYFNLKKNSVKTVHEVDAIIAAYTGILYLQGKYNEIDGVIIPIEENL